MLKQSCVECFAKDGNKKQYQNATPARGDSSQDFRYISAKKQCFPSADVPMSSTRTENLFSMNIANMRRAQDSSFAVGMWGMSPVFMHHDIPVRGKRAVKVSPSWFFRNATQPPGSRMTLLHPLPLQSPRHPQHPTPCICGQLTRVERGATESPGNTCPV